MAKPILITAESLAADALQRFSETYDKYIEQDPTWRFHDGRNPADIKHYLSHGSLTVERVEKVLAGWCSVRCDGCGGSVRKAVSVGDEADYESATAVLCVACVMEAAALASG